ncbi:deoxyribonuclease IV [Paenibacillus tarimensis]
MKMYWTGSHVSIGKGFREAARTALSQGGRAFQYFPKNPRSLSVKSFDPGDAAGCRLFCEQNGIVSIAHAPYPVNLAASDKDQADRTIASLVNDLVIAEHCGSAGVVVHFGIYKGSDILQGYRNMIHCLDSTLAQWEGKAKLLIENNSGEHALMGMTFEELAQIRQLCRYPEKIGFCLDTCHLFASGIWDGTGEDWLETARSTGVMDALTAVHLNDSRYPSGSRRDRHQFIGEGEIGEDAFRRFLSIGEVRNVPIVLETPREADGTHSNQIKKINEWMRQTENDMESGD